MGKLYIKGMKFHAYHGCRSEEASIGSKFYVDVAIESDFSKISQSDKLKEAVDYCKVYETVKKEMAVRSNLIEHVAHRIVSALKKKFPKIESVEVRVTKMNPPIEGEVESVSAVV